jgi:2,4-diaminopentanoate dehydrogenase
MIWAIQWATGAMGRTSLRRIIDHPDLELAGVYVYGARKAGVDAGQLARRPETGVCATNSIEEILATNADVVLHMARITLPYDALVDDVVRLLESGKNVVSTAGFHWPTAQGADYAGRLQAACLVGGATLAGVGVNPGLIVERIALAATALCSELQKIDVRETVDASAMASPEFVFGLMGLGTDPAQNDIRKGPLAELYTALFSEVLYFSAHAMGTAIETIVPDHQLTLAPADMVIAAGPIARGTVAATQWRWTAEMANGVSLLLSILWTADPALHGATDVGHWSIDITGRPNVTMRLDIGETDPAAPPSRALTDATVAVAIRAIPDVIAAPPGLFAFQPTAAWRSTFK